jgi:signal transduction histidine kinase
MKFIITLIFLLSFTLAQSTVNITSDTSNITDFKLDYFIDKTAKMDFEEIKSQKFTQGPNKDTLGTNIHNSWVRIKVVNLTNKSQTLYLHQYAAYLSIKINHFEVDEKGVILSKKETNLLDSPQNMLDGSDSIFKFTLQAKQTKTIYVNQKTYTFHFYNFSLFSEKASRKYLIYEKVDTVFLMGLLLALALYNFFIFISSKYKEYLYYSLYLLSATIWIVYIYGALAHYLNIYGIVSFRFNAGLLFTAIFLALFIQVLVDTKTKYKTEHQFLNSIVVILFINFLYGIIDLGNGITLIYFTLNYALVIFFSIGISIYRKGNKIIKIFLFAHIFYLIFNVYGLMFYKGIADFTYISFHGIGIGIMIEALILSFLVSYKFKIIEEEKKQERLLKIEAIKEQNKSQLLLLQKSKMADMGEMIGNIAHQWRQPLAVISISVGILRERKLINRLTDKDFNEELGHIDLNILHMSQTIEDFMSYFSPNKAKEDFYIADAVDKSLLIIGNMIYKENITISKNIDKEHSLYGFKEEYIQVLISILTNAIYALKNQEEKIININLLSHDKVWVLEISDNAGGISDDLIDKIFEPYFTTKDKSIGTGLGLYIAKTIIESSMNGSLKVVNTKEGAKFSIIIK